MIAIGFNCSAPSMITGALQEARSAWPGVPFVVYPNTGETWESGSGWGSGWESTRCVRPGHTTVKPLACVAIALSVVPRL